MTSAMVLAACLLGATAEMVKPGVWKTFKYEEAQMTNAPIVFTGWAKADVRDVADFCIWLDVYYKNGEHSYGRCAYFDRANKDWQQTRGVFKPAYPVTRIVVNALFRGNQWSRKGKPDGTCVFRDFTLERRAGTNEDFVITRYSNRPFANTIAEFTDTLDGERVTRQVKMTPHADAMTSPLPNGCPKVWASHSMRKVSPLTFPKGTDDEGRISILMARNERESAQVLVSMPADTEWTSCELELPVLKSADGTPFAGDLKWERQGYLAREPGFTPHPCALPDHERWFPEVLLPAAPMRVRACSTQGAWITVYAATNAVSGVYTGEIVVREGGAEKARVPMRVAVAPVTLPRRFLMPNAFALMDCHLRRVYGADWKRFRREAQDIMLDHRLNPDDISRTELPEIDDLLHARERGMNCFNILNVVPKPKSPQDMVLICKPGDVFNEKYYDYFFGKVKPFVEELRKYGLDKDAYVYGFDERGPEFYDGIREFWGRMQKEIPGIPLMNTAKNYSNYAKGKRKGDESLLMGDWYCPVTWDHDFAVSEEIRRKTGKKVWWYVCCGPLFCDYESNPVERRIFGLQTWQVKADGYLYWMMNYWTKRFQFSEQDTYFPDYKTGHWAGHAGGGMLLFPSENHVLPTIRLAQIRDGMEDYEFAVLHDRACGREATMEIVKRVSQFPGTGNLPGTECPYDADPTTLFGVRSDLLKGVSVADRAHRQLARWFTDESLRVVSNCAVRTEAGLKVYAPDGSGHYPSAWLRDFTLMLEADAVPHEDILPNVLRFVRAVSPEGYGVDCIKHDETKVYKPGYGTMGENPGVDGSMFTVSCAYLGWKLTGRAELLSREVMDTLEKTLSVIPHDAETGLVSIDPAKEWDRCAWGFNDQVRKTGCCFMESLLEIEARRRLAEMQDVCGEREKAQRNRDLADALAKKADEVFWDESAGLYVAATVRNRQHDVWGSAFAVWLGVAPSDRADRIAGVFRDRYDDIVLDGQVRHLPKPEYWEKACDRDRYMNGGYWGTASGWYAWTLARVDGAKAWRMLEDLKSAYVRYGAVEWMLGEKKSKAVPYPTSVTLPLCAIRRFLKGSN